jgi:ferritin-like metal-binding protein YciE
MEAKLQISRVEDCFEWLEAQAESYTATQSIAWLIDQMGELCKSLAFVNNQMAVAKKILNKAKVKAYNTLVTSSVANAEYFSPMLAKDYISARIEQEQYDYDICERCSRTVLHTIEALRTCISALKEEAKVTSF